MVKSKTPKQKVESYTTWAKKIQKKYGFLNYKTYKLKTRRKLYFSPAGLDKPTKTISKIKKSAKRLFGDKLIGVDWSEPNYPEYSSLNVRVKLSETEKER